LFDRLILHIHYQSLIHVNFNRCPAKDRLWLSRGGRPFSEAGMEVEFLLTVHIFSVLYLLVNLYYLLQVYYKTRFKGNMIYMNYVAKLSEDRRKQHTTKWKDVPVVN
jgi:hypothetical protein